MTEEESDEYDRHLERSRAVWDRRSESYERDERDLAPLRETALDYLELQAGDRVLDIGCGPGTNFERLVDEVGERGSVVAVDYSPEMVKRARERVDERGWETVEVRQADATTADFGEGFDAAVATLSMSVMPDQQAAVENVSDALRPGGTFVVFDIRPVPAGPARVVNPVLRRVLQWYANWNPAGDVDDAVSATFDDSELVETAFAGVLFTVVARKRP